MSRLPKKPNFDIAALNRIKTVEDIVVWLKRYNLDFAILYLKIFDQIENGGARTPNWDIKEATAADVTAGKAVVKGNLILRNRVTGKKHEIEA